MFQEGIVLSNHGVSMLLQGAEPSQALDVLGLSIRRIQQTLSARNKQSQTSVMNGCQKCVQPFNLEACPLPIANGEDGRTKRKFLYTNVLKVHLNPLCSSMNSMDIDDLSVVCSGATMFNLALCNHLQALGQLRCTGRELVKKSNMAVKLYRLVIRLLHDPVREITCGTKLSSYANAWFSYTLLSLYLIARNNLSVIEEMQSQIHGKELRREGSQVILVMNLIESTACQYSFTNMLISEEEWQGMTCNCLCSLLGNQTCQQLAPAA
jgi:hypothetical protein